MMDNRIVRVSVRDHTLVPASAEVHVVVQVALHTPTTELRGRLMGPRCHFASTIEVAYPLRPLPVPAADADALVARVVVPEASFWDPQSPFLYGGPVELWQDGQCCDTVAVRHGLRWLRWGPQGLRVNDQPFTLRGRRLSGPVTDAVALQLRRAGYNLLVAPIAEPSLWDTGDRLGFLVVGEIDALNPTMLGRVENLRRHPSCLGWLASNPSLALADAIPSERIGLLGLGE